MYVLWSRFMSLFRSLFGRSPKVLPVREVQPDETTSSEVIKLVVPDVVTRPERLESEPEDFFVLDDPHMLGDLAFNVLSEPHMPERMACDEAYFSASLEFAKRDMTSLVIPLTQFIHEWRNGVLNTVEYRQVGGNGGMTVPGCPLNDFTRIVAAMVKSAANNPPGVSEILKGRQYYYYVEIGHGTIRGISRMRD